MRANLEQWTDLLADGATLVSLAKGIELGTLMRMSQVIVSVTGVDPAQVGVISDRTWPVRSPKANPRPPSSHAAIPAARLRCSAC